MRALLSFQRHPLVCFCRYTPVTKFKKHLHPGDKYTVVAFLSIVMCVLLGTESEIQLYHLKKLEGYEKKRLF